ncbi:MAG: radical SAM protein [Planctomycetes bacterium]|nr:radical SAM protein [Planctomycetota bacterium]
MDSHTFQGRRTLLARLPDRLDSTVVHPHHVYPPLLLKLMEAVLRQHGGYEVRLIDAWRSRQDGDALRGDITGWHPDVVVLLPHPVNPGDAMGLASAIRRTCPCFLVALGPAVDLHQEMFLAPDSPFDVALAGESECEILALLTSLDKNGGEATRAAYRARGSTPLTVTDLDRLPFPTYSPDELDAYSYTSYPLRMTQAAKWGFLLSSRGCPHGCSFCSPVMRKTSGRAVRLRTVGNVVDEIEHLMESGVNVVSFEDDDLTVRRDHVLSICREITRRRLAIRWICHARVDELDPALLAEMKEAGCVLLRLGVESASDRILELFGKNPRNLPWRETCLSVFKAARGVGIATNALIIMGSPGETRAEAERTIDFVLDLDPDMIQVHFFTLYPGSALHDDYRDVVSRDQLARMHHYSLPVVNLSRMTLEELWQIRSRCYKRFFFRASFLVRHAYFHGLFYLSNPRAVRHLSRVAGIIQAG